MLLLDWLKSKLAETGSFLAQQAWYALGWLWGLVILAWNDCWGWVKAWFASAWQWVHDQVGPQLDAWVSGHEVIAADLRSALELISYFVPVKGLCVMAIAALTAAAVIRLVRWIKAFIPTIDS
jgi:hypothetical protein